MNIQPPQYDAAQIRSIIEEVQEANRHNERELEPPAAPANAPQVNREVDVNVEVLETGERRRILGALNEIEDLLKNSNLQDEITEGLRRWHRKFLKNMNRPGINENRVLNRFVALLENILIDPITLEPLDKDARLGSDGHSYDPVSLGLFLCGSPEVMRYHSPVDFHNPDLFTTIPHPIIPKVIERFGRNGSLRPRRKE